MADSNPYSSPTAGRQQTSTNGAILRRVRLASALVIPLAIVSGVLMAVIGMMRSFDSLAKTDSVEPSQLAGDISTSLSIGAISIPIAIAAFAIWLWATLVLRKRDRATTNGPIN
jgi:hypothetical protein